MTPTGYALSGFPGQFANAVLLPGAAHYTNRYRDYDPTTDRYIQADPIGLEGDANPYAYALGNPLRYADPSGEVAWIVPVAAAFAIGVGVDLAIQALSNWTAGKSVADPANYDPVSAALSGGLNVVTGGAGGLFGGARAAGAVCGSLDDAAKAANAAEDAASHGFRYADRVRQRAVEDPKAHNFPYSFDDLVLRTPPTVKDDGYRLFRAPGYMNNKPGNFEIGINRDGVIDHRHFRPLRNRDMYPD